VAAHLCDFEAVAKLVSRAEADSVCSTFALPHSVPVFQMPPARLEHGLATVVVFYRAS